MISIRSSADLERAMADPMDPDLRRLLALRRDQLLDGGDADLGELVHIVVVEPRRDTLAAVEAEAGVPLAGGGWTEWVRRDGAWLEAVTITDDGGFAVAVFVPDLIGVDPDLLLPLLAAAG